jgi:DMSO/TMAO reductase YedYZ molybdopterin-dependent catalytic subunit
MASVSITRRTATSGGDAREPEADLGALGKDQRLSVLTREPLNVETPLDMLDTPLTPVERMFMRNHHTMLRGDPARWSLCIDGLVRRPVTINLQELLALPRSTYVAVLECSGNGRSAFAEAGLAAEGLPWGQGAVACAEWTGVPVALLLERAGVKATALQAECAGGGPEPFVRGVEIAKLIEDAMLAYAVNGRPLAASHGGPVRLVVPGWGGVNWVKWITAMRLISHESRSEQNQDHYVLYDADGRTTGKVRELLVKSIITGPAVGTALSRGAAEVRGWAWSAGKGVARVEVSADDGASWHEAELGADMGPRAWRGFRWAWRATPGRHTLLARATDRAGATQPLSVPHNTRGYLNNAVHRVAVTVR